MLHKLLSIKWLIKETLWIELISSYRALLLIQLMIWRVHAQVINSMIWYLFLWIGIKSVLYFIPTYTLVDIFQLFHSWFLVSVFFIFITVDFVINNFSFFTIYFLALSLGIESLLVTMTALQTHVPSENNKNNLALVRAMSLTLASMGMTINRAMVRKKI